MSTHDLAGVIEQSHRALLSILNGDPSGFHSLYSSSEDVTLGNPFGPYARGRREVETTLAGAASNHRDGEIVAVDHVATYAGSDLACVVEVERSWARVGGSEACVRRSARHQRLSARTGVLETRLPPCRPDHDTTTGIDGHQHIARDRANFRPLALRLDPAAHADPQGTCIVLVS